MWYSRRLAHAFLRSLRWAMRPMCLRDCVSLLTASTRELRCLYNTRCRALGENRIGTLVKITKKNNGAVAPAVVRAGHPDRGLAALLSEARTAGRLQRSQRIQ